MANARSAGMAGATLFASAIAAMGSNLVFAQSEGGAVGMFPPCQVQAKTYTCPYLGEAQMIGAITVAVLVALFVGLAAWGRRYSSRAEAVERSRVGHTDTVA